MFYYGTCNRVEISEYMIAYLAERAVYSVAVDAVWMRCGPFSDVEELRTFLRSSVSITSEKLELANCPMEFDDIFRLYIEPNLECLFGVYQSAMNDADVKHRYKYVMPDCDALAAAYEESPEFYDFICALCERQA